MVGPDYRSPDDPAILNQSSLRERRTITATLLLVVGGLAVAGLFVARNKAIAKAAEDRQMHTRAAIAILQRYHPGMAFFAFNGGRQTLSLDSVFDNIRVEDVAFERKSNQISVRAQMEMSQATDGVPEMEIVIYDGRGKEIGERKFPADAVKKNRFTIFIEANSNVPIANATNPAIVGIGCSLQKSDSKQAQKPERTAKRSPAPGSRRGFRRF